MIHTPEAPKLPIIWYVLGGVRHPINPARELKGAMFRVSSSHPPEDRYDGYFEVEASAKDAVDAIDEIKDGKLFGIPIRTAPRDIRASPLF